MEFETSKQLAESLNRARSEKDPYFNRLLRIMATRCMTQAKYMASGDCAVSDFLHYGLAAPIYTHFTSPIRRYALNWSACCVPLTAPCLRRNRLSAFERCKPHAPAPPCAQHTTMQVRGRARAPLPRGVAAPHPAARLAQGP